MAATTLYSSTQYAAFVKSRFPQRVIESLVTFGKPTLSALSKPDDLVGKETLIPVETDHPQGMGDALSQLVTASANRLSSSRGVRWTITRAKGFAMLTVDGETMMAMRSDEGAWFRSREREVKNVLEQLGQQMEMMLWRRGDGSVGQVTADPGTGTTFVVSAGQSINFHEGMYVNFYANSSGIPSTTVRAGGPYLVTGVNYGTETITVSAALDTAIGADDFVLRSTNSGYNAATVTGVRGIPAWIPASDPTDTFFGVARTLYPQKLGGFRQSWLGSIEETVKRLDANIRRVNQKPKTLWLSYANFNRLEIELGARGVRLENGQDKEFGAPSLRMSGPGGPVSVKAGPYVPETGAWLLDMDTWALHTLGALPHIIEDDGNTAMRVQSMYDNDLAAVAIQDAIEIRFRWMCQLVCTNPFANGYAAIT